MKMTKWLMMVIGALTGIFACADTATLKLGPVTDTRIFNGSDQNDGAGWNIGVYQSRDRSLLKFPMPVGATLNSASLTLFATELYGGNPNAETMSVYRLTQAWTEAGVGWNKYDGANAWAAAGGDYAGTVYASSSANPASGQPISWDVTALAQEWANGIYVNNGLLIINSGNSNGLHFGSKEHGNAALRPYMTATVTTPTAPPAGSWTWNGGDGTIGPVDGAGMWSDANKWWDGIAVATWSDNIDAIFGAGSGSAGTVTISGSVTPRSLWFTSTGAGNYAITEGTLDFGNATRIVHTDVNATIQSAIANGGLIKQGAGTLSLYAGAGDNGANVYYQDIAGGLNILAGTVEFTSQYIRMGTITINDGAMLHATVPWATGASNPWFDGRSAGSITVNAGGTLHASTIANGIVNGLTLNGGTVSGTNGRSDDWGNFIIASPVTAGGATNSAISAELAVYGMQNFSVASGSTLAISGMMHNRYGAGEWWQWGGVTKLGLGTLTLSGNNFYTGNTTVSGGMLDLSIGRLYSTAGWIHNPLITITGNSTVKVGSWSDGDAGNKGGFGPITFNAANIVLDTGILEYTGGMPAGSSDRGFTIGAGGATLVASGTAAWQITNTGRDGAPANQGLVCNGGTLTLSGAANGVLCKDIGGAGGIVKTGNGVWTLSATNNSYAGNTVISNGTLRLSVTGGATRHFDASALGLADNAPVTQWNDLSGNHANATVPSGNATPTYLSDAGTGTGLGAVNFLKGAASGGGAVDSQALAFTRTTNVRSLFTVFKGSGFLMTDSVSSYDLHRPGDDNPADALLADYGQINYLGKVYVNGTEVANPTAAAMPTASNNGYNLVALVGNGATFELDSFNKDRIYHSGNQSHAETILFDYVVSETQRQQIEAYLNKKWFNIGNGVSNLLPIATSVTLANNSTLDLGGMGQTVAGLSGSGVVSNGQLAVTGLVQPGGANAIGTLTVPANTVLSGTLQVDAAGDGTCDVLAVQGSVNLSEATLNVTNTSSLDWRHVYTILTCSGTPEPFGAVSVAGSWGVTYRNGSVKLVALGTMIRFN
jgi:autotransporter-associated beta strand protein